MRKLDYVLLFLVAATPFIIYMFNPVVTGADTYFYINQICGITEFQPRDMVFDIVLRFFDCNLIQIKFYLMLLWFGCLVVMSKIGELYDKERGVLAGFIMGGLTLFIFSFFVFENDSLGYLLFLISFYFLLNYDLHGRKSRLVYSIIFLVLAGLTWKGTVYWVMVYPIFSVIFLPLVVYILACMPDFWYFLNADRGISEHSLYISAIYWGVAALFMYGFLKTDKKLTVAFVILAVPALMLAKLYVLCIPFVVLFAFNAIRHLKVDKTTVFTALLMVALMAGAFWGMQTFNNFPTEDDTYVIQSAIDVNSNVQNVFGVGYYVKYLGGTPSSFGMKSEDNYVCKGVVIERSYKEDCNCPIFAEKGTIIAKKC